MKRYTALVTALLISALCIGACGTGGQGQPAATQDTEAKKEAEEQEVKTAEETEAFPEEKEADRIGDILASMTVEDKAAQMLMPAFRFWTQGEDTIEVTELNDQQTELLKKYHFGGIILFAQNLAEAEQSRALITSLQEANLEGGAPAGLLISTDQEGGGVSRLVKGTQMPGSMALGATGDSQTAVTEASVMAGELASLGIQVDFAPVMDVNSNPSNPVIGCRSFSDDPETVAAFGMKFIEGLHSQGILSSLKHFPGHGDTDTDSHTGLPSIDKSLDQLRQCELIPFAQCLKEADMVMTAHIVYPQIETGTYVSKADGSEIHLPATLSKTIITGLLRDELGFEGVIVTDAMNMDAIAAHFDTMDAARYAINAGVDMMLMPVDLSTEEGIASMDDYIGGIAAMVEKGEIPEERLDQAVTRILALKEKCGLLDMEALPVCDPSIGTEENHLIEWEIACRALTLLKNEDQVLPLKGSKKILITLANAGQTNSALYAVSKAKEEGFLSEDTEIITEVYGEMTPDAAGIIPEDVDTVIAVSVMYSLGNLDPENENGGRAACLDALFKTAGQQGTKLILISGQLPYDAARFGDAQAILCCYGARGMNEIPDFSGPVAEYGPNLPAAIYAIFGSVSPQGNLPVNIPVLQEDYTFGDEILYERGTGLSYE